MLAAQTRATAAAGTVTVTTDPLMPPSTSMPVRRPVTGHGRSRAARRSPRARREGRVSEHGRIVAVSAGKTASLRLRLTANDAAATSLPDRRGGIQQRPAARVAQEMVVSRRRGRRCGGRRRSCSQPATVAPTIGALSASPPIGLVAATPIAFSAAGGERSRRRPVVVHLGFR